MVVRTFMAHHQGMTLLAATNALLDNVMVDRFHADSHVKATELLLQERMPREAASTPPRPVESTRTPWTAPSIPLRRFRTPHTFHPHAQFLSNGSWVTVVTNAGGGSSRWRDLSIVRSREDRTLRPRRAVPVPARRQVGAGLVADVLPDPEGARRVLHHLRLRQGRLPAY